MAKSTASNHRQIKHKQQLAKTATRFGQIKKC